MKKIIFLFFFLGIKTLFSQSTYQSSNYANAGDSILISIVPIPQLSTFDFAATGQNYFWNFDSLSIQRQTQQKFQTPASTNYQQIFLMACVAGGQSLINCYSEWNSLNIAATIAGQDSTTIAGIKLLGIRELQTKSTNSLKTKGFAGKFQNQSGELQSAAVVYNSPDIVYNFPISYGNQDSCVSSFIIDLNPIGTNLIYKRKQKRVNIVEGYGNIKTPYKTFSNVLKMKTLLKSTDTLFYNDSVIPVQNFEIFYRWFSPTEKIPVLEVIASKTDSFTFYRTAAFIDTVRELAPVANFDFSQNPACKNDTILFNNLTINGLIYFWDFGDSTTSMQQHPKHSFQRSGKYSVKLLTINQNQQRDSVTKMIEILQSPFVALNSEISKLRKDTIALKINDLDSSFQYFWFPNVDLSCNNCFEPKCFADSGRFYTVNVENQCGTAKDSIFVNVISANFRASETTCKSDTVYFQNLSQGKNIHFLWKFENEKTDTAKNTYYVYNQRDTVFVKLIVYNEEIRDSVGKMIFAKSEPTINFSTNESTIRKNDTLQISISTNDQEATMFWNDTTEVIDFHTFTPRFFPSQSKNFVLSLRNVCGTTKDSIFINVIEANFSFTDSIFCVNDTIFLKNTSQEGENFIWKLNNKLISTEKDAKIIHHQRDTLFVTLQISKNNVQDSISKTFLVDIAPKAEIDSQLISQFPAPLHCVSHSIFAEYLWKFQNFTQDSLSCLSCANPVVYKKDWTHNFLFVTVSNQCGKSTDSVIVVGEVGVIKNSQNFDFQAIRENENLILHFSEIKNQELNIEIFDMQGKKILFENVKTSSENKQFFNLSHCKSGIYILKISGKDFSATKKFVW